MRGERRESIREGSRPIMAAHSGTAAAVVVKREDGRRNVITGRGHANSGGEKKRRHRRTDGWRER